MVIRFSTALEQDLLVAFDQFITRHGYQNRSEAVRDLIRKTWWTNNGVVRKARWWASYRSPMNTSNIIARSLTDMQHEDHDLILSTTHVHLDHDNCLEVIMVRGPASRVKTLADRLIALRGVKHGGLTITASGQALK